MTRNNLTSQTIPPIAFYKPVLIGAAIALLVISFFVFGVDEPDPRWPKLWQNRPLIITPLAGAMGGAFFYFIDLMASRGMNRTLAVVMGIFGFVIALWLGTVLGLDGTMWN